MPQPAREIHIQSQDHSSNSCSICQFHSPRFRCTSGSDSLHLRKFGKHLQKRQLDIPEYAASFVNYKALKKVPPRTKWKAVASIVR